MHLGNSGARQRSGESLENLADIETIVDSVRKNTQSTSFWDAVETRQSWLKMDHGVSPAPTFLSGLSRSVGCLEEMEERLKQYSADGSKWYYLKFGWLNQGGLMARMLFELGKVPFVLFSLLLRLPGILRSFGSVSKIVLSVFLVLLVVVYAIDKTSEIVGPDNALLQTKDLLTQHLEYAATMMRALGSKRELFVPFTLEDGQNEWQPQIQEELDHYDQVNVTKLWDFVRRLKEEGWKAACDVRLVIVFKGALYFDSVGLEKCTRPAKLQAFDKHLRSVLDYARKQLVAVPDCVFVMSTSADGVGDVASPVPLEKWGLLTTIPVFVIAKKRPEHAGVRIPNMYFGEVENSWHRNMELVMEIQNTRPWSSRWPKAYWRGNCGHLREASWPRVQIVHLSVKYPNSVDASLTEATHFPMDGLTLDEREMVESLPVKPRNSQLVLSKYKFLANMPGSSTGSYSKNLQSLWPHGSVVLMWENAATEWYYEKMVPGETHVSVNAGNFMEVLQMLKDNDREAERIAANGLKMFQRYLSADSILMYWALLLRAYRAHSNDEGYQDMILPEDACTCDLSPIVLRPKCPFCEHWLDARTKSIKPYNSYLFLHGYTTRRKH